MVSAYLGGHLVFGEQIGVDHTATADNKKPEEWTPVIANTALQPDKPPRVVAGGAAIQCPWHQSELALADGHVVNGPATFPARCFEVRVREGQIEVRAASKHAAQ